MEQRKKYSTAMWYESFYIEMLENFFADVEENWSSGNMGLQKDVEDTINNSYEQRGNENKTESYTYNH